MFIQAVNLVKTINFKGCENKNNCTKPPDIKPDTFERTTEEKSLDGIHFSDETFEKAKNDVIKSAISDDPRESLTLIVDDDTFELSIGTKESVPLTKNQERLALNPNNRLSVIHSHTPLSENGITTPVSPEDLALFNRFPGMERIYAIRPDGKYSLFERNGGKIPSLKELECFSSLIDDYITRAMGRELYNKKVTLAWNKDYYPSEQATKAYEDFFKSDEMLEAVVKGVHNFWLENAQSLGVNYETNYFD